MKHTVLQLPLVILAIIMALACGGGEGGNKTSTGSRQTGFRLKAGDLLAPDDSSLLSLSEETYITIAELGGEKSVALKRTQLTSTEQEIDIDFVENKSYVIVLEVRGLPFLRTTVLASQIAAAKESGVLDIGRINSVTTYLTGLLEVNLNGARRAAGDDPETAARSLLAENFGAGVNNFSFLRFSAISSGQLPHTPAFSKRMNRINLLSLYFHAARFQGAGLSSTQLQSMAELYASIFDESSATNLLAKLSNPALPDFADKISKGKNDIQILSARGIFLEGEGVLEENELRLIFWEPQSNGALALKALQTPIGKIAGKIDGALRESVLVQLEPADSFQQVVGGNQLTSFSGDYAFSGLLDGSYRVKPLLEGFVFDPPQWEVSIQNAQFKSGYDFTSFQYIAGSTAVPNPAYVLSSAGSYYGPEGNTLVGLISSQGSVFVQPGNVNQSLPSAYYSYITIYGNANLQAANIVSGANIFGVVGNAVFSGTDVSATTITPSDVLNGGIFYDSSGTQRTGSISNNGAAVFSPGFSQQTPASGYYSSITVEGNANLLPSHILAGVEVFGVIGDNAIMDTSAGNALASDIIPGKVAFVNGNLILGSMSFNTLSDSTTILQAGTYAANNLVSIDSDLASANIRSGVNIFGITGDGNVVDTSAGDATAGNIMSSVVAYADGAQVVGTLASQSLSDTSTAVASGFYAATDLSFIDTDLVSASIKGGVTLFGITGDGNVVDTSAGDAAAGNIMSGVVAYANGAQVVGTMASQSLSNATTAVASGFYAATDLSSIDADLVSANIKGGVTLFGITGDGNVVDTSAGTATAGNIMSGVIAYVGGSPISGTMPTQSLSPLVSSMGAGYYPSGDLASIDTDLIASNLTSGSNIFGVEGSVILPDASDVLLGKSYGPGNSLTGTASSGNSQIIFTGSSASSTFLLRYK
ncbi:MAG: hypothetical protein HQL31_02285 [Planctomycetes bacterium]|nr:hypothetical protein [Planctomycetota bacterium]